MENKHMGPYIVRWAGAGDAEALRALNQAFNADRTPLRWVHERLADATATERVLVAVTAGRVIGFCCVTIVPSFCRERPRAEVTELFVDKLHRRQGVARKLMMAAARCAKQAKVLEFFVLTNKRNRAGRCLYKSLGYVEGNDLLFRRIKKCAATPNVRRGKSS